MDFDVLGIKITSCVWDGDLVIKGERSYDRPEITFFNAMYVDGLWDVEGKEILCVEKLEDEIYQILLLTAPFVQNQSVSVVRKLSVCMPTPFPKSA